MTIPTITLYAGVTPDPNTQNAIDFSDSSITWTAYQASSLVPDINTTVNQINITAAEVASGVIPVDASINTLTFGRGGGNVQNNTASGFSSLLSNTTGDHNTANGRDSLGSNTTGNDNTSVGYFSLFSNVSGNNNTATGSDSLVSNTNGNDNTAAGQSSLRSNTTGNNNTANGAAALYFNLNGGGNAAFGKNALFSNIDGNHNTSVGFLSMQSNTYGSFNVAVGKESLQDNTTGNNNTASGCQSLFSNVSGSGNTANGFSSLLSNTTGGNNTANGVSSLLSNTTGGNNTANGVSSLRSNTTGGNNTANGVGSLRNNTTGSGNASISPMTSGGAYSPVFDPTTENNRMCLGSTAVTNAYVQVAWTVVSDERDKTNFNEIAHGLDFVNALNPISYQFRVNRESAETNGGVKFGFRAQDILALEGDSPVIVDNEDPEKLRMIDTALIPVLVKAMQELTAKVEAQQIEINLLKSK